MTMVIDLNIYFRLSCNCFWPLLLK